MRSQVRRPIVCRNLILYFIARVVILIAGRAVEWDWNPLVVLGGHWLIVELGGLHELRFIRSSSFKLDRFVIFIGYAFGPENIILLWVLRVRLNNKRLILIFVGTLPHKGYLV